MIGKVSSTMDAEELLAFFDKTVAEMRALMVAKNHDYTANADADALLNFHMVEIMSPKIKTEYGFITRMSDKLMRLAAFATLDDMKVKDEGVKDTLKDIANYAVLWMAHHHKKGHPMAAMDPYDAEQAMQSGTTTKLGKVTYRTKPKAKPKAKKKKA